MARETSPAHLFRTVSELLDAEVFVEVSANEKEAEFGAEPDEGVGDADHNNLPRLSARAAVPDSGHSTRGQDLTFHNGLISDFGEFVTS